VPRGSFLAPLLPFLLLLACDCGLVPGRNVGGASPPPAGSLSVSFIVMDAGRVEEGPNVVDLLRSRDVESLDGIVCYRSPPFTEHLHLASAPC
jgi:hypothetical protein